MGGGRRFQTRKRVGAWLAVPKGASPGKGWLAWQFHRGGESKGFGVGGEGLGAGSRGFDSGGGRW